VRGLLSCTIATGTTLHVATPTSPRKARTECLVSCHGHGSGVEVQKFGGRGRLTSRHLPHEQVRIEIGFRVLWKHTRNANGLQPAVKGPQKIRICTHPRRSIAHGYFGACLCALCCSDGVDSVDVIDQGTFGGSIDGPILRIREGFVSWRQC
jgi:hypothetical protein